MSEGEIPISGLDIRRSAIRTPHLVDLTVTTPKIADVAVTIEKTDEPVWVYVAEPSPVVDFTLTTTQQEIISHTITIPSWVGTVSVYAQMRLQITNSSGATQGIEAQTRFNDVASGGATDDVANGTIGGSVKAEVFELSSPGASIEVSAYGRVRNGTSNAANATTLHIIAFGVR